MVKLAIDAMGGDYAPKEIVEGVNIAIEKYQDLEMVLFGKEEEIKKYLKATQRVTIINAEDKLDMGEKDPFPLIRKNKELSMCKAFNAVHMGECDGVVTAGPTQGAVVAAHLILKRLPGIKRVAICPELPSLGGKPKLLLDSGANIDMKAEYIHQHGQIASIYVQQTKGIKNPVLGLINIGSEPGKGRELEREVYNLLKEDSEINFYGNIEPKEMFASECDIVLSDGFSANLVMKTMEGTAKGVGEVLKEEIKSSLLGKIGYLFMRKNMKRFKKRLSSEEIGGAVILGVDGVVVKAHGGSSAYAFSKAIEQAKLAVEGKVIEKMKEIIKEN